MDTRVFGIGVLLSVLAALAAAQTEPVRRPPSAVSPQGFPAPSTIRVTSASGPAKMAVRLYMPAVDATDKALLPIIVEVYNGTEEDVTILDDSCLDFTFD